MRFSYKVWDSEVIVRNRPHKLIIGEKDFKDEDRADAYLSVTDTWVDLPNDRPFVWLPWNEGRDLTPDHIYGVNRSLLFWTYYKKLKSIQFFCDGGTHRSVSLFGSFLITYFNREEREEIVKNRVATNELTEHFEDQSNPLEYIEGYLEKYPADRLLMVAMGNDYMSRLEVYMEDVYNQIKVRYGDKKVQ